MDKRLGGGLIGLVIAICLVAFLVYDQYHNAPAPVESAGTATSDSSAELPLADEGSGSDETPAAEAPPAAAAQTPAAPAVPAAESPPPASEAPAPAAESPAASASAPSPAAEAPAVEPPLPEAPSSGAGNATADQPAPPPAASAAQSEPPAPETKSAETLAATEPSGGEAPASEEPSAPSAGAAGPPQSGAAEPPAEASATAPSAAPPSFDVVRVEPTGETVIAGQAPPGAEVEILDRNAPIAAAEANERGEWAMALDRPLPPGSHDLAIRTTTEDRKTVTLSDQRVAVSVPGNGSKDVLVVINTPDAASRVVEAGGGEGSSGASAAAPPAETAAPEAASAPTAAASVPSEGSSSSQPASATASVGTPAPEGSAAPPAASGEGAATVTAAAEPQAAEPPAAETPAPPAPAAAGSGQPTAAEPAAGPASAASSEAPSEATPKAAPAGAPAPAVAVTAVEADTDGTLFIAGTAATADSVRVYLDDRFIGETRPTDGGTWLLQARRDLPAGRYQVRADQVDRGGNVLVRAEVPFEREVAVAALKAEGAAGTASGTEASGALPNPQTVIIKRGDNLWRLSRSMYGRGMRWSTIYTANRDQIRNPRWIYPGQVFVVPAGDAAWKN